MGLGAGLVGESGLGVRVGWDEGPTGTGNEDWAYRVLAQAAGFTGKGSEESQVGGRVDWVPGINPPTDRSQATATNQSRPANTPPPLPPSLLPTHANSPPPATHAHRHKVKHRGDVGEGVGDAGGRGGVGAVPVYHFQVGEGGGHGG
jgi:hypothetical protein